jgi:hypothetical protein
MLGAKAGHLRQVRILLISICLAHMGTVLAAPPDPTEQFKAFLQRTQSIDHLSFKLLSGKHRIRGLEEGTFREFNLVYGNPSVCNQGRNSERRWKIHNARLLSAA